MTDYGFTVWARIASIGTCRKCRQRIVWRVNRATGKQLPFNGLLLPLHTLTDPATHQPMEVLSRDDLHMVTCPRRRDVPQPSAGASA